MSYCLSGTTGRAAYGLEFEFEFVKSPSSTSTTRTSHTATTSSSSPSSTISESSNSPLAISTRKPRTPRKRPNQTYNEAAALLSTVYPNIFSTKQLTKPYKSYTKPNPCSRDYDESSDFLLFYPPVQEKPSFRLEPKFVPGEVESNSAQVLNEFWEEGGIDTESILDDEVQEEGVIDSIMGNASLVDDNENENENENDKEKHHHPFYNNNNTDHQVNPIGLGFGMMRGVSALRRVDDGNWWCFPIVDVSEISPRLTNNNNTNTNQDNINGSNSCEKKVKDNNKKKNNNKNKKNKKEEKQAICSEEEVKKTQNLSSEEEKTKSELLLKLNYDDVLNAWSGRASPFPDDISGSDSSQYDLHARLAQIDLFSENGGLREASVMRYKEKRRTRLFSKKIRYQVRKVNADRRPRMKGRFVRRSNSKEAAREKKGLGKK